ncbi:MAG: hypothetical protein GX916_04710 [Clostridiales bacterium]|nr:hypothetical protein [Clostridiales bacterium]
MTWRRHFQEHILFRGLAYYQDGRVQRLRAKGDVYTAQVQGMKTYNVSFRGTNEAVEELSCTCPHAEQGENCKHLAAAMYAAFGATDEDTDLDEVPRSGTSYWDDEPDDFVYAVRSSHAQEELDDKRWDDQMAEAYFRVHAPVESDAAVESQLASSDEAAPAGPKDAEQAELAQLIARANAALVRKYLYKALLDNVKLQVDFREAVKPRDQVQSLKAYVREYGRIFTAYTVADGDFSYLDDDEAFGHDMTRFMEKAMESLASHGRYMDALELMLRLLQRLSESLNDIASDSDFNCYSLLEKGGDMLSELALSCKGTETEKALFDRVMQAVEKEQLSGNALYEAENLLFRAFDTRAYNAAKIDLCHRHIQALRQADDLSRYVLDTWVQRLIDTMVKDGATEQELDACYQAYWDLVAVRLHRIDRAIEKRQHDTAIRLIEEERQRQDGRVSYKMLHQLKDLYRQQGRKQDHERLLWDIAASYGFDMDLYRELKALYNEEEWPRQRERLLSLKGWQPLYAQAAVFSAEGLNDRLLQAVLQSSGTSMLKEYEKQLMPLYADELLKKYVKEVQHMAADVTNRRTYQEIVRELRRIRRYPGGGEAVRALVQSWRVQYKNRRAMMEELDKL